MVKKIGDYKIPFDNKGNQYHYPPEHYLGVKVTWKDNFSFEDTIELLEKMSTGRSAKFFHARSLITKKTFTIFTKDLLEFAQKSIIDHGKITDTFTFCKRGQNYGLTILEA